ncbi:MAG: hypothetical protein H5U13_04640 [Parvibaculum sp.]|nr:hypothetical protein [Parvibaculum sp.]
MGGQGTPGPRRFGPDPWVDPDVTFREAMEFRSGDLPLGKAQVTLLHPEEGADVARLRIERRAGGTMSYDPATRRLSIGLGYIENVPKEVWEYEVSGKNVLRHWFSYRKRDRSRPVMGDRRPPSPLEKIQPDHWLAEYTSDLLDLLHVLGRLVRLEARQADLLARICDGPLLSCDELEAAGAFALPKTASQKGKKGTKSSAGQDDLFQA